MPLYFEVLEKDIAGRIGRLTAGSRRLLTPAILPVINPHLPLIAPDEMRRMGVEALITNAYILYKSAEFCEIARKEGLHRLLGFDGIVMTDSGAYQQSVYGDLDIGNGEIVEFQMGVGSDIVVPLDIPTPPSASRERASAELDRTMHRVNEAIALVKDTRCAGPVQGGIYEELREEAGRRIAETGVVYCPIGAVVPLMEQYRYTDLVRVVLAAKRGLSPAACVHLFGAGHPSMFAFAVAMGCDIFDSAAYALYAKEGKYLSPHGTFRLEEMNELTCCCEVCTSHTAKEIAESDERTRLLALHNLRITIAEIAGIREAIRNGTLWELVDSRARSHPKLLQGYRELMKHGEELEKFDRVSKRRYFYRGEESCLRTEVLRYQRMLGRLSLEEEVHIFVGCVNKELGGSSLLFKPPFGPYPVELSETFPIGQSEVPAWDRTMVEAGCTGIRRLAESHPGKRFTVHCSREWFETVRRALGEIGVRCEVSSEN